MHEIPPHVEHALRAQGVTNTELEELRRTGSIERSDDSGSSMFVQFGAAGSIADGHALTIQDIEMDPAALAKLRQFHRFIPRQMRDELERATGEDIDGDGDIGGSAGASAAGHVSEAASPERVPGPAPASGRSAGAGPFVDGQRSSRGSAPILVAVALVALGVWLVARLVA